MACTIESDGLWVSIRLWPRSVQRLRRAGSATSQSPTEEMSWTQRAHIASLIHSSGSSSFGGDVHKLR